MALLDLPAELLDQIFEDVGGRELRRGVGIGTRRLTLSRQWYEATLPIYLSGIEMANVKITGRSVDAQTPTFGYSGTRRLMHKNTRALIIRVYGHWWVSSEETEEDIAEQPLLRSTVPAFDPFLPDGVEESPAIQRWQDEVLNPSLTKLGNDLPNFSSLENFHFEVLREADEGRGPQWDWLHAPTCQSLLRGVQLSRHLTSLHLDTSGSALTSDDPTSFHACHALAGIIPYIPTVRIRMPSLCIQLFSAMLKPPTRLPTIQNFIIKLNQPHYLNRQHRMTEECTYAGHFIRAMRLHDKLIIAASTFAQKLGEITAHLLDPNIPSSAYEAMDHLPSSLKVLRISFVPHSTPSPTTVDCLSMRRVYYIGQERFDCEEDGRPRWIEDDEREMRVADAYASRWGM